MNLIELQRALRQLRLGGTAAVLENQAHGKGNWSKRLSRSYRQGPKS